jgi:hypothetical protein
VQRQGELTDERTTIEAQLIELHHRKYVLETEWAVMVDLTKAWAWARAFATTIYREGLPHPTFAKASQNVVVVVALLNPLSAPSTDEVDKMYHRLKDILGVVAA